MKPSPTLLLPQPTKARRRWKIVIKFVLTQLRNRRLWARLGEQLKVGAKLFDHLERRKGTLCYKKR